MRRSTDQVDRDHAEHVGSGPHDGPRCSCKHDGVRWTQMCERARAAWEAAHQLAQRKDQT